MRRAALAAIALVLALVAGAAADPDYGPATGVLGSGSWSWFGDPRAVTVDRRTVVGWIDPTGAITVASYPKDGGAPTEAVVGHEYHDDHSAPSLVAAPDGRVTVFWSAHNGSALDYRTTVAPGDVTASGGWGPIQSVPVNVGGRFGFTYPNPVPLAGEGGRLYLFWRGGDWSADYSTLAPGGTWTTAHRLIEVHGQRPYVKYAGDGSKRIAIAFTNGHPANAVSNIYYMTYRHGSLWTAAGRWIKRIGAGPVFPGGRELVYNASKDGRAWVWDVALTPAGRPVIVFATFPTLRDARYWYAAWDGRRWRLSFLADAGGTISPGTIEWQYSGGITLDHADPSVVYLSRQVRGGWQIERWVTLDLSGRWHHGVVIPTGHTENVRPVVPRGADGDAPLSLVWLRGDYGAYTNYHTQIAYLR